MKKPLALCLQTLAVVLLSSRLVVADGVECDSIEATSGGRGGTNIAQSDNGAVLLSNPAGIFNVEGNGLVEVGANGLITDLHYANPINDDTAAHTRPIALPMFSYIEKVPDSNWAFGLGVFAPAGFAAGWDLNNNVEGNQSYKSFGSLLKVLPAVSYQVLPGLTIGATLGVANSYIDLDTPFNVQTGPLAGAPVHMELRGDGYAPTWSLGMQYQLSPATTFGLSYTSEDRFNLDGHVQATLITHGWSNSDGIQFAAEHRLAPIGRSRYQASIDGAAVRLSGDVVWYDWKNAFKDAGLTLSDPTNPVVAGVIGSELSRFDSAQLVRQLFGPSWLRMGSIPKTTCFAAVTSSTRRSPLPTL